MPSITEAKLIRSLKYKKYRSKHGLFIVEGPHLVEALMQSGFVLSQLYATEQGLANLHVTIPDEKLEVVKPDTLASLSSLTTPRGLLATAFIPHTEVSRNLPKEQWVIGVDGVQDPGNLGTIIRTADWFGFPYLVCSSDTVDAYNPKVVQATMGSIFHTSIEYKDLPSYARDCNGPVYALAKNGLSLYQSQWPQSGLMVVGHETKGIREELEPTVTQTISIPGFGKAESLNAAVATAVTLSQLRAQLGSSP
jgi:TrmH family RNA methyltransferase